MLQKAHARTSNRMNKIEVLLEVKNKSSPIFLSRFKKIIIIF